VRIGFFINETEKFCDNLRRFGWELMESEEIKRGGESQVE